MFKGHVRQIQGLETSDTYAPVVHCTWIQPNEWKCDRLIWIFKQWRNSCAYAQDRTSRINIDQTLCIFNATLWPAVVFHTTAVAEKSIAFKVPFVFCQVENKRNDKRKKDRKLCRVGPTGGVYAERRKRRQQSRWLVNVGNRLAFSSITNSNKHRNETADSEISSWKWSCGSITVKTQKMEEKI